MIEIRKLSRVQALVEGGRVDEAEFALGEIASKIPDPASISSEFQAQQVMEVCGFLSQMLKKHGQFEMAIPWLKTLCQLACKFAPRSVDTAWDHYHCAEGLAEYADRLAEPSRTNYRDHARKMCDQARTINDVSDDPSSQLAEKIRQLTRACT